MSRVQGAFITLPADPALGDLAAGLRVKLSGGVLVKAGAADVELGIMSQRYISSGLGKQTSGSVLARTAEGTGRMVASEAIALTDTVFAAANGKVAASGSVTIGIPLTAADADGDELEVLRFGESDVSDAVGGTTAAAFLVDSDAVIPKIELASQGAGVGDFKVTIKPAATLTGNRVATIQDAATQVLVARDTTDTLTNKTMTAPVLNAPVLNQTPGASTAAAGVDTTDAAALPAGTASFYPTTAADDVKGVKIHVNDKVTGRTLFIGNGVSDKILKVYGPTGAVINGAVADAAFSSASGKGVVIICLSGAGNTWAGF